MSPAIRSGIAACVAVFIIRIRIAILLWGDDLSAGSITMAAVVGIVFGLAYAGLGYRNQQRAQQQAADNRDGDSDPDGDDDGELGVLRLTQKHVHHQLQIPLYHACSVDEHSPVIALIRRMHASTRPCRIPNGGAPCGGLFRQAVAGHDVQRRACEEVGTGQRVLL